MYSVVGGQSCERTQRKRKIKTQPIQQILTKSPDTPQEPQPGELRNRPNTTVEVIDDASKKEEKKNEHHHHSYHDITFMQRIYKLLRRFYGQQTTGKLNEKLYFCLYIIYITNQNDVK